MAITEIDSLEHDTTNGTYNSLVKIDSTHFILAYMGTDNDGFIKTFSIPSSGWSNKIFGITTAKVFGIAVANIAKINGVE